MYYTYLSTLTLSNQPWVINPWTMNHDQPATITTRPRSRFPWSSWPPAFRRRKCYNWIECFGGWHPSGGCGWLLVTFLIFSVGWLLFVSWPLVMTHRLLITNLSKSIVDWNLWAKAKTVIACNYIVPASLLLGTLGRSISEWDRCVFCCRRSNCKPKSQMFKGLRVSPSLDSPALPRIVHCWMMIGEIHHWCITLGHSRSLYHYNQYRKLYTVGCHES